MEHRAGAPAFSIIFKLIRVDPVWPVLVTRHGGEREMERERERQRASLRLDARKSSELVASSIYSVGQKLAVRCSSRHRVPAIINAEDANCTYGRLIKPHTARSLLGVVSTAATL